ncbi:MAG: YqiA/YcfP family alpha/beta fold hydrolase [Gammaproteobacteria bacterium]
MIIYLHGFNSSPLSSKAVMLAEYCAKEGAACAVPQLSDRPKIAAAQIGELLKTDGEHALIGSSMGGYYATWFCENRDNARAVLINPAVRLAEKLAEYLGREQKNYHTGETYMFEERHLEEFRALEVNKIAAPEKYFLLAQTGDEVLDYREAEKFYAGARHLIEPGGDHSFTNFAQHLPAILKFAGNAAE